MNNEQPAQCDGFLMLSADSIFWPAIAFMIGCSIYFGPRIKSHRVAMQWWFDGKPTWTAPKSVALWLTIAFALLLRLLIWLAMTDAADRVNHPELGLLLVSLISAAVHFWLLWKAAQAPSPAGEV